MVVFHTSPAFFINVSDFFHFAVSQHIHHNLCAELEAAYECFAVSQHVDFTLGVPIVLKKFLLLRRQ